MSEDFSTATLLLVVGMVTVFTILGLIVLFGNWLILLSNRFFPEPAKIAINNIVASSKEIDPKKLAAIVTAVDIITSGKGKVESIRRDDKAH